MKPLDGIRVLMLEDDWTIAETMKLFLDLSGAIYTHVTNGKDALAVLDESNDENRPRIIFTDMRMPIMDGDEFTRRVRADSLFANIPIIMATSDELTTEFVQRMKDSGVSEVIPKPVLNQELIRSIQRNLAA